MEEPLTLATENFFTLSNIGSVASILGFIITLYLFWAIRKIKNDFLSRIRIPKLRSNLHKHAKELSELLRTYPDNHDVVVGVLSVAQADIVNLKEKNTTTLIKTSLIELDREIENFIQTEGLDKQEIKKVLWSIHAQLLKVNQNIYNYIEDDKWRQGNG